MENCTNDSTVDVNATESSSAFATVPFLLYNLLMLIGVLVPVTVGDAFVLIALGRNKKIPVQIRETLQNILLSCFIVIIALFIEHITAVVLTTTDLPEPPREFCSFIFWLLSVGRVLRFVFTATFSVVVFVMVVKGEKAVNRKGLLVASIALWIMIALVAGPVLSQAVVGTAYIGGAACFPMPQEETNGDANKAYIALWAVIFGAFPLLITIIMPLAIIFYINKHRVSTEANSNRLFLKAMTKLAVFLVVGNSLNFLGQAIPPVVVIAMESTSSDLVYVALVFFNLSLYPTPILMLVYVDSTTRGIKALLLHYCCRIFKKNNSSIEGKRPPSHPTVHSVSTDQTLDLA